MEQHVKSFAKASDTHYFPLIRKSCRANIESNWILGITSCLVHAGCPQSPSPPYSWTCVPGGLSSWLPQLECAVVPQIFSALIATFTFFLFLETHFNGILTLVLESSKVGAGFAMRCSLWVVQNTGQLKDTEDQHHYLCCLSMGLSMGRFLQRFALFPGIGAQKGPGNVWKMPQLPRKTLWWCPEVVVSKK